MKDQYKTKKQLIHELELLRQQLADQNILQSKRKRAEEALRKSEERFRVLVENSMDAISMHAADGTPLYVSPSASRILGYDDEELVGVNPFDFLHPDDIESAKNLLSDLLQNPERVASSYHRVRHKDGSWRWIEATTQNLLANPNVEAIVSNYRDITVRVQTELELRQSEERFAKFFHANPGAIALIRLSDAVLIEMNETFLRLLGYRREELVDRSVNDWINWPDPIESAQLRQELSEQKVLRDVELSVRTKSGEIRHLLGSAGLTDIAGETHVLGLGYDVTDRKRAEEALRQSEERFRTLVEQIPAIVYAFRPDEVGSMLYISPQIESMLGFSQAEWMADPKLWRQQLHPDDCEHVLAEHARRRAVAEPFSCEYRLLTRTGRAVWVHDESIPVRGEGGQARFIQGVALDITERKRADARLEEYAIRLRTLSRRLLDVQESERRFIARELHDEIGQLLTGLKLSLEMTTRLPADAVEANRQQAQALVTELMERVSRLSLELRPTMLDDLGLLPALVWHLNRYTTRTDVKVDFKHRGVEGRRFAPEVESSAYRIAQEALTNVARHAGVNEVRVRLWSERQKLGIQIEDHGCGFDPKPTLAAGISGGISGMRERAALLGGQLTIESAPGAGTRLMVELPVGTERQDRKETPAWRR